jgi:hypothetical protein
VKSRIGGDISTTGINILETFTCTVTLSTEVFPSCKAASLHLKDFAIILLQHVNENDETTGVFFNIKQYYHTTLKKL